MTNVPNTWRPSAAAQQAINAAQQAAQNRLKVAADCLLYSKVPLTGILYKMCVPAPAGQPKVKQQLQLVWPGVLQLLADGVLVQSANLFDAHCHMPVLLQRLRAVCPADKVLIQATMRRPHTTPVRLVLDAAGVLHVIHTRTRKALAVSVAGNP